MELLPSQNLKTLLDINEYTSLIFNDKIITVNNDKTTEHINNSIDIEYTLYFTYNELFNVINQNNIDKFKLINDINNSIDNLYENEQFLKILDENKSLDNIMNDLCLKIDIINEEINNSYSYKCIRFNEKIMTYYDRLCEKMYDYCKDLSEAVILPKIYIKYDNSISDNESDSTIDLDMDSIPVKQD